MNKRMLLVSLLTVATVFRTESMDLKKKAKSTKEYQELEISRYNTRRVASCQRSYEYHCLKNKSMLAYFSKDCRIARDMKKELYERWLKEMELAHRATSTPEYNEWLESKK